MRQLDTKTIEAPKTDDINKKSKQRDPELSRENKELMYGDKAYKRTMSDTIAERDLGYGRLHTFGGSSKVEMFWDYNKSMTEKQLFKLRVDGKEVILSAIEMQKLLRWV